MDSSAVVGRLKLEVWRLEPKLQRQKKETDINNESSKGVNIELISRTNCICSDAKPPLVTIIPFFQRIPLWPPGQTKVIPLWSSFCQRPHHLLDR